MSEAEVVEQLVEFTNILLAGVSVFFTVVGAYVTALNYFIGQATFIARLMAFLFITVTMGMLAIVMVGAQFTQQGLIARLRELDQTDGLSAAGRAVLANAAPGMAIGGGASLDDVVRFALWTTAGLVYAALAWMTFVHKWKSEIVPVQITTQGS
ncbi:MAG: hypothetical protein JNJ73_11985 [Hyphomonadaceae bacterium]|nr:hypothetical protein [Hyphomonadaceae bacterium]